MNVVFVFSGENVTISGTTKENFIDNFISTLTHRARNGEDIGDFEDQTVIEWEEAAGYKWDEINNPAPAPRATAQANVDGLSVHVDVQQLKKASTGSF